MSKALLPVVAFVLLLGAFALKIWGRSRGTPSGHDLAIVLFGGAGLVIALILVARLANRERKPS